MKQYILIIFLVTLVINVNLSKERKYLFQEKKLNRDQNNFFIETDEVQKKNSFFINNDDENDLNKESQKVKNNKSKQGAIFTKVKQQVVTEKIDVTKASIESNQKVQTEKTGKTGKTNGDSTNIQEGNKNNLEQNDNSKDTATQDSQGDKVKQNEESEDDTSFIKQKNQQVIKTSNNDDIKPVISKSTGQKESPESSEQQPEPEKSESSEKPKKTETSESPEQNGQPKTSETSEQPETSESTEQANKTNNEDQENNELSAEKQKMEQIEEITEPAITEVERVYQTSEEMHNFQSHQEFYTQNSENFKVKQFFEADSFQASEKVKTLCNSQTSYLLNDDNWVSVGLKNNHNEEYHGLIEMLTDLLPQTQIYVSFELHTGQVCVAADVFRVKINVDDLLGSLTGKGLEEYQLKEPIIQLNDKQILQYFEIRCTFTTSGGNYNLIYDKLMVVLTMNEALVQFNSFMKMHLSQIIIQQSQKQVYYIGRVQVKDFNQQVYIGTNASFYDDIIKETNQSIQANNIDLELVQKEEQIIKHEGDRVRIFVKITENGLTLQELLEQMLGTENNVKQHLKLTKGVEKIENLRAQVILLEFFTHSKSLKFKAWFENICNFAVNPSITITEAFANIRVDISADYISKFESFNFLGKQKETETKAIYQKTIEKEQVLLVLKNEIYSWKKLNEEFVYKVSGKEASYIPVLKDIIDYKNTFLKDIYIEIQLSPTVYWITAELILLDQNKSGRLQMVLANINDEVKSFLQIQYKKQELSFYFPEVTFNQFPLNVEPIESSLFYSEIRIDQDQQSKIIEKIQNFNVFGPRVFWKKGVFVDFVFKFEEYCGVSQMCQLFKTKNLLETYHLQGYLEDLKQDITLKAQIDQNIDLGNEIILQDNYLVLDLNQHQIKDSNTTNINKNTTDDRILLKQSLNAEFSLESIYTLNLGNDFSTKLKSNLQFSHLQNGILKSNFTEQWENPFKYNNLHLSQILVHAHLTDFLIDYFTISSLGIFGNDCLKTEKLAVDCFYGTTNIYLDFKEHIQSYFQGTYNVKDIIQLDKSVYNGRLLSGTHKSLQTIEFTSECSFSHSQNNIINDNQIIVPQGQTIQGQARYLGIDGKVILNIQQNETVGIFHFKDYKFAGKNVIIYEESLLNNNNIVFKINEETLGDFNKQVIFQSNATVFGQQKLLTLQNLDDKYLVYFKDVNLFNSKQNLDIVLSAPYSSPLENVNFIMNANFQTEHVNYLSDQLKRKTLDWLELLKLIKQTIETEIQNQKEIVEQQFSYLCDSQLCLDIDQCTNEPVKQCINYKKEKRCTFKEVLCVKTEEVCVHEQNVCIQEIKIDDKFNCVETEPVCMKYEFKCEQEETICRNESDIETKICLEEGYHCTYDKQKDESCVKECEQRQQNYNQLDSIQDTLMRINKKFNQDTLGLWSFYNSVKENEFFIYIDKISFRKELLKPLERDDINMAFTINLMEKIDTFTIEKYNFYDIDSEYEMVDILFQKIFNYVAQTHNFSKSIVNQDYRFVIGSIISKEHDPSFLQMGSNDFNLEKQLITSFEKLRQH